MRSMLASRSLVLAVTLVAALAAACGVPSSSSTPPPKSPGAPVAASGTLGTSERIEDTVRADYFAGIAGDDAAFARAMKVCDDALAVRPDDAEALVWRGCGRLFEAGMAYRAGDTAKGGALWGRALGEMDRAVALAPDAIGVRIPRGAALLGAAPYVPSPAIARPLYERAAADYAVALRVQEPTLSTLSLHAREELLFGLADSQAHLGEDARARSLFERLVRDCPDSHLVPYARAWLSGAPKTARPACTGCHAG